MRRWESAALFVLHNFLICLSPFDLKLLGTPDEGSLKFLQSDNARKYVKQLPSFPRQNLAARFPNMSPLALDLLGKMLVFDPTQRITGKRQYFNICFYFQISSFFILLTYNFRFTQLMMLYVIHIYPLFMI